MPDPGVVYGTSYTVQRAPPPRSSPGSSRYTLWLGDIVSRLNILGRIWRVEELLSHTFLFPGELRRGPHSIRGAPLNPGVAEPAGMSPGPGVRSPGGFAVSARDIF
jgi:hypothetical protein